MSSPPCFMKLRISDKQHNIDLWLPLFLAWMILLAIFLALLPVAIFLILVMWPSGWGKFILMLTTNFYRVLRDLKDLKIEAMSQERAAVSIYFR